MAEDQPSVLQRVGVQVRIDQPGKDESSAGVDAPGRRGHAAHRREVASRLPGSEVLSPVRDDDRVLGSLPVAGSTSVPPSIIMGTNTGGEPW